MVLLDTHVWLWFLLNDGPLPTHHRTALDKLASQRGLAVSWTSVWETAMLVQKQRVVLDRPYHEWLKTALHPSFISLIPADVAAVLAQERLPESFHNDPADRLITATAMLHNLPLASFDNRIIESGCVSIWQP
jgi:PIN domain nuclease of toxin-antitoxin system